MQVLLKLARTATGAPFSIPDAARNVSAVRTILALTLLIWVGAGPLSSFYPQEEAILYRPTGLGVFMPGLGEGLFAALKTAVLVGCMGMLWRRISVAATCFTAMTFAVLNCYVAGFSELWNYNTHINIFLFALSFAPGNVGSTQHSVEAIHERNSAILFFMRLQVAAIYLQAGLAKLLSGGVAWSTLTPYLHIVLQDGWAAQWLTQWPTLVMWGGIAIVLTELLLPVALMVRATQPYAAAVAIALHLVMFATLNISFWHLWVLFPALFMVGNPMPKFLGQMYALIEIVRGPKRMRSL